MSNLLFGIVLAKYYQLGGLMRLASLIVWLSLIFGSIKLTLYGYDQVMKQISSIQHTYVSIGDQFNDPDIRQTSDTIGALKH